MYISRHVNARDKRVSVSLSPPKSDVRNLIESSTKDEDKLITSTVKK
jgi:hypothetical protein